MGLINWLGTFERDNTGWSGYEHAPEAADFAGSKGVKIMDSPSWLSQGRPFTIANTVFVPEGYSEKMASEKLWDVGPGLEEGSRTWKSGDESFWAKDVISEEVPHIAQWREEGVLGFLGKQLSDIWHFGEKSYHTKHSHEGFHHKDPAEKARLTEVVFGKGRR